MKRLITLVVIIVGLLVASQLLLPIVVSQIVAQGMIAQTGSDHAQVQVEKTPALLMLGGSFDKITVSATNARIDKLTFSEVNTVLTNAQLDMGTLVSRRAIALQSVDNIEMAATITDSELAKYLNQSVKGIKNATVSITPDKVKASSSFAIASFATVGVTLEGRIAVDSHNIKFVTERFLLNNGLVGNIGGSTLTEIPLVDVTKLPFSLSVRDIAMESGKVIIHADNHSR